MYQYPVQQGFSEQYPENYGNSFDATEREKQGLEEGALHTQMELQRARVHEHSPVRQKEQVYLPSRYFSHHELSDDVVKQLNILWRLNNLDASTITPQNVQKGTSIVDKLLVPVKYFDKPPIIRDIMKYLVQFQHVPEETVSQIIKDRTNSVKKRPQQLAEEEGTSGLGKTYIPLDEGEAKSVVRHLQACGIKVNELITLKEPSEVVSMALPYIIAYGSSRVKSQLELLYRYLSQYCKKDKEYIIKMMKFHKDPERYREQLRQEQEEKARIDAGLHLPTFYHIEEPSSVYHYSIAQPEDCTWTMPSRYIGQQAGLPPMPIDSSMNMMAGKYGCTDRVFDGGRSHPMSSDFSVDPDAPANTSIHQIHPDPQLYGYSGMQMSGSSSSHHPDIQVLPLSGKKYSLEPLGNIQLQPSSGRMYSLEPLGNLFLQPGRDPQVGRSSRRSDKT